MAILKIARMGHPVLRQRAKRVADATAPEIERLIDDMFETLEDVDGAGLAAPQVHHGVRLVMFQAPAARAEDEAEPDTAPLTILINPTVTPLTEETALGWEACLSVPGLAGLVPRFTRVRYSGLGPDGKRIRREATGFHARVVQHEVDHLAGILYPQRMDDLSLLSYSEELKHWRGDYDGAPDDAGTPEAVEV